MTDRYLYRGKRIDNGEWIEGVCVKLNNRAYIAKIKKIQNDEEVLIYIEVIPETVGQCVGLRDKNGKLIFEGDIVKGVAYSVDFRGVITWISEIAGFGVRYFNSRRRPTAWENSSILKVMQHGYKNEFAAGVIGNIHDNPELLKGE